MKKAEEIGESLPTLGKVEKLRRALHAKAKRSPDFRFYSLYDKVYRLDVLQAAYERCLRNGGVAGVDRQTFEDIHAGDETILPAMALEFIEYRQPKLGLFCLGKPEPEHFFLPHDRCLGPNRRHYSLEMKVNIN